MKVTTLIENELGNRTDLYNEHGISVYIEAKGKNILFDTGKSGNFINNAKKLHIDLKDLDTVIISHSHYDHSGGFKRLTKEMKFKSELILGAEFFNKKYSKRRSKQHEYTGSPFDEQFLNNQNIDTRYIKEDMVEISEDILVFSNFDKDEEFENTNYVMYIEKNGEYIKDEFNDEISLAVKTDKGLVVVVGCSHVGIVNILNTIINRTGEKIYALIGGTHMVREDDEKINKIIDYLSEKDIKVIGACHCTGKQGLTMLAQQLGDNFIPNNTGDILEF